MKRKTSELCGLPLRLAVVAAMGGTDEWSLMRPFLWNGRPCVRQGGHDVDFQPDVHWSHVGPLIAEVSIALSARPDGTWVAFAPEGTVTATYLGRQETTFRWKHRREGNSPQVAACRCYVALKLGEEVEIAEELT